MFTRAFVLEQKCPYDWGEQALFLGAQDPKSTLVAPGQLLSFGAQSSFWGTFFA